MTVADLQEWGRHPCYHDVALDDDRHIAALDEILGEGTIRFTMTDDRCWLFWWARRVGTADEGRATFVVDPIPRSDRRSE